MSASGLRSPYAADMPMQPRPCAETSSPCEPSFIVRGRGGRTHAGSLAAAIILLLVCWIDYTLPRCLLPRLLVW